MDNISTFLSFLLKKSGILDFNESSDMWKVDYVIAKHICN